MHARAGVAGKIRELMEVTGLNAEIAALSIDQATAGAIVDDALDYLKPLIDRHVCVFSREDLQEIVVSSLTVE